MVRNTAVYNISMIALVAVAAIGLTLGTAIPASAHGGKGHGEDEFTAFQAVQKASQLYDRLITAGKLDDGWETELAAITVDTRNSGGNKEFVIKFMRSKGEKDSVYFFFDLNGDYTGSNFSGK